MEGRQTHDHKVGDVLRDVERSGDRGAKLEGWALGSKLSDPYTVPVLES